MIQIGVDFGGTKIEVAALDLAGRVVARARQPTPPGYDDDIEAVARLVAEVETMAGSRAAAIGVGGPGSVSASSGLIRNANSTQLNGRDFPGDLARRTSRPVRYANDANCLALSEAVDGAGAGHGVVFAAILGTGCGGGLCVGARSLTGRNGIAGEWGHSPLPWPNAEETPGPQCWCGRRNCLELWISGSGLARDHGGSLTAEEVIAAGLRDEAPARAAYQRYVNRLARGLAVVCNLIDPDVIILGGGMSNVAALYGDLAKALPAYVFSDQFATQVLPALHGDSSGVRGAAWLWTNDP